MPTTAHYQEYTEDEIFRLLWVFVDWTIIEHYRRLARAAERERRHTNGRW